MVMFGMLLALGMLIDGGIVVTEYANRMMSEGMDHRRAYIDAVNRMFWPVTASTATTLAAFLPMLFWPGVSGQFMGYLPVTVFHGADWLPALCAPVRTGTRHALWQAVDA